MKTAYDAQNLMDAQLVCDLLHSAGIPARVSGAGLLGAAGELPAIGVVQVLVPDDRATHMHEARHTLQATMGAYLPWMQPPDAALYIDLLRAPDADALSGQFFRCFDLMVRTRGTAIAVLRMHELYRLLQPHVAR